MSGNLEQLLEDGVIDEVLSRLKSGKEADVWLVRHRDEVLAAKVYKERAHRSFKNNSGYKEGRTVRNTRTQRAMDRGSRFGQEAAEEAWKSAESDALHRLHAQGVRVPAPVLFYEGILLMKLVLDADGQPAPRLIDVAFEPEAAAHAYADLRAQAVRMLCSDLIHGDLSAYNVLMAADGPTVIDFPQVISAAQNSTAAEFFKRDIENLRTFFAGFDPALAARNGDGPEIWQAYVRRELTPEFVPSGRPVREPAPRAERRDSSARPPHGRAPGKPQQRGQGPRGAEGAPGQGQRGQGHGSRGHGGRPQPGAASLPRHAGEPPRQGATAAPQKQAASQVSAHSPPGQGAQARPRQERPRHDDRARHGRQGPGNAQRTRQHEGADAAPRADGAQRHPGARTPAHGAQGAPRADGAQRHPGAGTPAHGAQGAPRADGAQRHPGAGTPAHGAQGARPPADARAHAHRVPHSGRDGGASASRPHGAQSSRHNASRSGPQPGALARPGSPPRPGNPPRTAPIVERVQRPAQPGLKPFPPPGRRPPRP